MSNMFESTENFEDEIDPVEIEPTPQEIEEENFEASVALARNEDLPIENQSPTPFSLSEKDWQEVVEKANKYDELQERLTKTHDKAFGKIGQLEQDFREFKALRQQPVEQTAITKETFKNVTEYFADEDFAEKLAQDLAGIQFGQSLSPANDEISKIREELKESKQQFEVKILTMAHPDWNSVINKPEFQTWSNTLNDEGKAELLALASDKWDGLQAANAISAFKNWESKKADAEKRKQDRLAAAIPVKNAGSTTRTSTLDAEDAFNAGLKSVQSNRKA